MKFDFTNYSHIIIDYSTMFVNLDSEVMNQLASSDKLIFAPTFECECRHFLKCVPERVRAVYWSNLNIIRFSSDKVCNTWGITDAYGLSKWFSNNYGKTLIIEANLALEDKIIFSDVSVEVYSWDKERIIKPSEFANERDNRVICKRKDPLPYYEVTEGNVVYSTKGSYVLVGDPKDIGSGAESNIYKLRSNDEFLAKIYLQDYDDQNILTKQKLQNIINLQELGEDWDIQWLALPQSVLFADSGLTKPVGYLMKKIDGQFLSDTPLFASGNINEKFVVESNACVRDVLDICMQFISQFMFLSANGINLTDYNDKNFALKIENKRKSFNLIDTDSYCYDEYISECITFAGALTRHYECNNKLDLLKICEESLFVYIFTRLVLDPDYKPLWKGEFRFSDSKIATLVEKSNQNALIKWKSIPENLQKLYTDVFEKKHVPSIGVLLYELEKASKQSFANTKYVDIYKPLLDLTSGEGTQSENLTKNISSTQITHSSKKKKKKSKLKSFFESIPYILIGAAIGWIGVTTVIYFVGVASGEIVASWNSYFDFLINYILEIFKEF